MTIIPCAYLNADVELTDERRRHILDKHPDLLLARMDQIVETVTDPDMVRRDSRFPATRLLSCYYADESGGKHLVVVVVSDSGSDGRNWIVTAYLTRRVRQGEIEWKRT